METIIKIQNISKFYTKENQILENINFSIFRNQSIGLLGHNGSGKTTLLRMIAGLTRPSAGMITFHQSARQLIGYAPEHFPKPRFSAPEYLYAMGRIQKLPKLYLKERIKGLLEMFNLSELYHMTCFSKGMTQKINLLQAVLGNPSVLILDEPLSGLDIASQNDLAEMLQVFKRQGITIVMSCHETKLLDQIANRVLVIRDGTVDSDKLHLIGSESVVKIVFSLPGSDRASRITDRVPPEYITAFKNGNELYVKDEYSDSVLLALLEQKCSILSFERNNNRSKLKEVVHHRVEGN